MTALFSNITLNAPRGPLHLSNRIVIAPMCQYACDLDGKANDWHLMHWGNLLNSGAGLLMIEATAVTAQGRITPNCLGLWDDATANALADTLARARKLAPPMPGCLQIAHAGRKGSSAQWLAAGTSPCCHPGPSDPPPKTSRCELAHPQ